MFANAHNRRQTNANNYKHDIIPTCTSWMSNILFWSRFMNVYDPYLALWPVRIRETVSSKFKSKHGSK